MFAKKITYQIIGIIFGIILLLLPASFAAAQVLGSPKHISSAIEKSGAYERAVPRAIENFEDKASDADTKRVLSDVAIQQAIKESFPPGFVQKASEQVINAYFAWLQGKTDEVTFSIDATDEISTLGENLETYGKSRANGLPECTVSQLMSINFETRSPLSLPCKPSIVSSEQFANQFRNEVISNITLFDGNVITENSLSETLDESLTSGIEGAPANYQKLQQAKWVLLVAAVILGAILVFGRRNRLAGLRHIGWKLLLVGFFYITFLAAYSLFISGSIDRLGSYNADGMDVAFIRALINDVGRIILIWAGGYIGLGGALLLIKRRTPRQPVAGDSSQQS